MRPHIREKKDFAFAEVPENTSFEAGYLVTVNSGWRSIRPVINRAKCVGCEQCYLYCPDGVIAIKDGKAVIAKVQKASQIQGTKYIHVIAPCPTGWGVAPDETVDIAREVVDCGLWYLAEYENGEFTLNHKPKEFTDVAAYLKKQGRFKHLTDEDIQVIIDSRDKKWEKINSTFKI